MSLISLPDVVTPLPTTPSNHLVFITNLIVLFFFQEIDDPLFSSLRDTQVIFTMICSYIEEFMAPFIILLLTAWVVHVVERQTALREVEGSSPRPDQHLGLEITEENVLPFLHK